MCNSNSKSLKEDIYNYLSNKMTLHGLAEKHKVSSEEFEKAYMEVFCDLYTMAGPVNCAEGGIYYDQET